MKKEIPILFSAPMVRAILGGRKTMTRRIVKPQPHERCNNASVGIDNVVRFSFIDIEMNPVSNVEWDVRCPYGKPGDLLWVRETIARSEIHNPVTGKIEDVYGGSYVADGAPILSNNGYDLVWEYKRNKVPSIHMPKAAARIWLEVFSVKVERLQDISEEDAIAEGIMTYTDTTGRRFKDYTANASGYGHPDHDYPTVGVAVASFRTLWDKINGPESWEANPFVWVIEFKRVKI
jgi:hypothetical protein